MTTENRIESLIKLAESVAYGIGYKQGRMDTIAQYLENVRDRQMKDEELAEYIENSTIKQCAKIMAHFVKCPDCPIFCDWVSETKCHEYLADYLKKCIGGESHE